MKVYVFEEGSCRGSRFGGRYTTTIKQIEKLASLAGDEEAMDDFLMSDEVDDDAMTGLVTLCEFDQALTYEDVLTKLKNREYVGIMLEESSIGMGVTKQLAKDGYMSVECDMDDDWD